MIWEFSGSGQEIYPAFQTCKVFLHGWIREDVIEFLPIQQGDIP
jgi:hypothetical protein